MPMWRRRELLAAAGLAAAGLAVSCATTPTATRSAETAWTDLARQLRGSVVRPGDTDFSMLATPRNLRFAATMPEAVVLCLGPDDVAATVSWARKANTPFAIRGGGHNYADGSSSRGIIISTRRMNSTHVDGGSSAPNCRSSSTPQRRNWDGSHLPWLGGQPPTHPPGSDRW